jgi:ADP-ribosylglycohydrolase
MMLGGMARSVSAGWIAQTLEEAQVLARSAARAANEPYEGVRGAEALGGTVWLARQGLSGENLREQAAARYRYELGVPVEERADAVAISSGIFSTVAIGLDCGLQATSVEEAIRFAAYIGGDTASSGAIAGAIAEARFGLPKDIVRQILALIPKELQPAIAAVYARAGSPMWRDAPELSTHPIVPVPEVDNERQPAGWLSRFRTRAGLIS